MNYAIPIDTVMSVVSQLKHYGRVRRPWLGLQVVTNTPVSLNIQTSMQGVVVSGVYHSYSTVVAGSDNLDQWRASAYGSRLQGNRE